MKRLILLLFILPVALGVSPPPILYYSDIARGPNVGGRNNTGSMVTIFGNYFGATRGTSTVTFGGAEVAEYYLWSNTSISVSLGSSATSGSILVTVTGAGQSNDLPFTVGLGQLFYAGATTDIGGSPGTASDSNNGAFNTPVATIKACKNKIRTLPGAICYVRGYPITDIQTGLDTYATIWLQGSGTASAPISLVAWPGDANKPIIGDYTYNAIYNFNQDHWVIAGFDLRGSQSGIRLAGAQTDFRIVGNKFQCPGGDGQAACFTVGWLVGIPYPPQVMSFKFYGNELTNNGCGDGPTGGINDASTASGQINQFPCAASSVQPNTINTVTGTTLTLNSGTFSLGAIQPGDHILVDTDSNGIFETSMVQSLTSTSVTLASNSFATIPFSAKQWKIQAHISNKLYHTTYFGTDTTGVDFGWNWIHNNSANSGFNAHSTAQPSPISRPISSITATTPALVTLSASFQAGTPTNGQRIDIAQNSQIAAGRFFVLRVSDTQFYLYTDSALTIPYGLATPGTGGNAIRAGFGQFNISVHDNIIDHQNGSCVALANMDPDRGPVTIFNNLMSYCGTGPVLAGSLTSQAMGGFYMLNVPDGTPGVTELYGTGIVEAYNNSIYGGGIINDPAQLRAAILMSDANAALFFRTRNNIWQQLGSLPYAQSVNGGFVANITGSNNIWFGASAGTIPPSVTSNLTTDPQFVGAPNDLHIADTSPAFNGGTIGTPNVPYDASGLPRPQNPPGYSLGAYEYPNGGSPVPPVEILTTTLPAAATGATYSQALQATGGVRPPYVWTVTAGSLPPGITLSSAGLLSGMPTLAGSYSFTVRATDTAANFGEQPLALDVVGIFITSNPALPDGSVASPYAFTFAATAGTPPYTWNISAGSLPPGLSMSSAGNITGTPTAGVSASFTIRVVDSAGPPHVATQPSTLTIRDVTVEFGGKVTFGGNVTIR